MIEERSNDEHHWAMTRQNTDDISEVKEGVARLDAGMTGLGDQMRAGFHTMNQSLALANREKPPVQWWAMGSLLLAMILAFGYFFTQATAAGQREDDLRFKYVATQQNEMRAWMASQKAHMDADNDRERTDAHSQGMHDAKLRSLEDSLGKVNDFIRDGLVRGRE
jgi:hypothetical protein